MNKEEAERILSEFSTLDEIKARGRAYLRSFYGEEQRYFTYDFKDNWSCLQWGIRILGLDKWVFCVLKSSVRWPLGYRNIVFDNKDGLVLIYISDVDKSSAYLL